MKEQIIYKKCFAGKHYVVFMKTWSSRHSTGIRCAVLSHFISITFCCCLSKLVLYSLVIDWLFWMYSVNTVIMPCMHVTDNCMRLLPSMLMTPWPNERIKVFTLQTLCFCLWLEMVDPTVVDLRWRNVMLISPVIWPAWCAFVQE